MGFLNNSYKPYSFKWFIQRSIIVIKEGRLPQWGVFAHKNKKKTEPVQNIKSEKSSQEIKSAVSKEPDLPISCFEFRLPEDQKNAMLINTYFDCIYLLNLKHRPDKRLRSIFQLKQMGIKALIVDGINGYQSPYKDDYEQYASIPLYMENAHPLEFQIKRKCISSPGAWGVLKSKKMILQHALKNNYKRILLLQDDLFFIKDFHEKFEDFLRLIDDDWKLVQLGASQFKWKIPDHLSYSDPSITEYDPAQRFYHPLVSDGAFALGVDHSVFQLLIDEIDKMNCSFDSGPVRAVYQKYQDKCYVCQPNLIIADVSTSDIRSGLNQENYSATMKWDLDLYDRKKYNELVSVIMPAYNAENTIEKSLRSLLIQTYENLELIVVDDGSTDKTPDIVRELAAQDQRIIFRRNEQNRGCYFARNDALHLAKGAYIAVQDADDISLKNRIEKQLIPLVSGNAFMTFCLFLRSHCSLDELDLNDQESIAQLAESRRVQVNGQYSFHERYNLAMASSVYKREMFEKYGLFWEGRYHSDGEFVERLLFHEAGITFDTYDENGYSYISKTKVLPDVFSLIEEFLYLSPERDDSNLTLKYDIHGTERKEFIDKYRARLRGKYDYRYPELL